MLEKLTLGDPLRTVVVDVGGGVGHDLVALGDEYAALQRRMIVQDIPVVVKDVKVSRMNGTASRADPQLYHTQAETFFQFDLMT